MRYFDEQLVANSRPHRQWWRGSARSVRLSTFTRPIAGLAASTGLVTNAAAVLPRDAWLEMDTSPPA